MTTGLIRMRAYGLIHLCPPLAQFRSLFVQSVPLDVSIALWDHYLLESDPYLVFYMSLVLLVNSRYGWVFPVRITECVCDTAY